MRQNRNQYGEHDRSQRRSQSQWGSQRNRSSQDSQSTWPRSRSSNDRDYEQQGYEPGFSSSYRSGTSYYPGTSDRGYAMGGSHEENAQNFGRPFSDFDRHQGESYRPWSSSELESGLGREQYWGSQGQQHSQQGLGHQWGSSGISSYGSQSPYGTPSGTQSQSPYARQYGQDYESYRGGNQFGQSYNGIGQSGQKSQGKGPKGYRRSDERIREDVCETLSQHHLIDASDVEVNITEGVITLSGTVESRQMKRMIEDCIETVSGVKDVKNEIKVEPSSASTYSSTSMNGSSSRSGGDTSSGSNKQSSKSSLSSSGSRNAQ